jgi:hypothetical protein
MKLKKILGLLIIVVALFGFTGCDDILEIWFEDELSGHIGGDGGGENGIGVWVEIIIPPGEEVDDPQIAARVEELRDFNASEFEETYSFQNVIWPNWDWTNEGELILSGYIELYGIPSGTQEEPAEYKVIVWMERTTGDNAFNEFPDFDEPAIDAEYERADGSRDTVFRFPNAVGSWIEAEANLFFIGGGGEPMNHDFRAKGPFIVDVFSTETIQQYEITPRDPGLIDTYSSINWRIVGRDDFAWYAEANVNSNAAEYPAFNVDLSNLTDGEGNFVERDYWIEFEVFYDDGWVEYKKLPLRVVQEASAGVYYDLYLSIWGVTYDPWYLDSSTQYRIWYDIFDADGATGYSGELFETPNEYGDFELDFSGIPYNSSAGIDGIDRIRLIIDMNDDGLVGPEDLRIHTPLVLSYDESGYSPPSTWIWLEGWDLRPVYMPPPE